MTHLKAHRTVSRFLKRSVLRRVSRTKGGRNSKLPAVRDDRGRPLVMLLSESQMSDYKGAALMIDALPKARAILGDRGYDADWFREALAKRGLTLCVASKANRNVPIQHDRILYWDRHEIEIMSWSGLPPLATSAAKMRLKTPSRLQRIKRL